MDLSAWFRPGIASALLLYSFAVFAGNISFGLSLTGTQLTITNTGDSTAFYPTSLSLLQDGRWLPLQPGAGQQRPAELAPGEHLELTWPDARPLAELPALLRLRPVMVRFFDQAGVGFGQISFFNPPPPARATLKAAYVHGQLRIIPPASGSAIRATWVLWPQEDGIEPIASPLRLANSQPPAFRFVWRGNMSPVYLATGGGLPEVLLLHETAQGYQLQRVAAGWAPGEQQRAAWLRASPLFYRLGSIAAVAALLLAIAALLRGRVKS